MIVFWSAPRSLVGVSLGPLGISRSLQVMTCLVDVLQKNYVLWFSTQIHLISVPICYLQTSMKSVFFGIFSWNHQNHPTLKNILERMFTFSFPIYLALISGILYHVFSLWCSYFSDNEVYTIEFKNGQFNQCNQTFGLHSKQNVTNFRNNFAEFESHYKSKFLILSSLVFLLFHVIESLTNCHNGVASLSRFIYGPNDQECNDQSKTEEGIQLDDLDPEKFQSMLRQDIWPPKQTPKSNCKCLVMTFKGLMSLLGLVFLVLLYLAPLTFPLLKIDVSRTGIVKFVCMMNYLDKSWIICLSFCKDSWPCKTENDVQCQFPFKLDGQWYKQCANFSKFKPSLDKTKLHCAINNDTDNFGVPAEYGPCSKTCPGGKLIWNLC